MLIGLIKKNDLRSFFLGVILLFPILKHNWVSILIIFYSLVCLSMFFFKRERFSKVALIHALIAGAYSLVLLFTLLYSYNLSEGLRQVQHGISTFVFPLIILIFHKKIEEKQMNQVIWFFFIACFFTVSFVFWDVLIFSKFSLSDITFRNNPFRRRIMSLSYLDIHPTYLSMWLLFLALFFVNKLFYTNPVLKKTFFILIIVFLVISAIVFTARGPLIGFFIALLFIMITKIKSRLYKLLFFFSVVAVFFAAIIEVSFLKSRFVDEYRAQKFQPPVGNAHTSTNIRIGIYQCAFEIQKENFLMGIGVGDVMERLNLCYKNFHTRVYEEREYNSHNEYLNVLLSGGIVGLSFFLFSLGYQTYLGLSSKNYLYVSFLILVITCLLFENFFSRMHGSLFYGVFNAIFIKKIIETNE